MTVFGNSSLYSLSNFSVAKFVGRGGTPQSVSSSNLGSSGNKDDIKRPESDTEGHAGDKFANDTDIARKELDGAYKRLKINPADFSNRVPAFRALIFDEMNFNRRELYSIASNSGGQFTKTEIAAANQIMNEQAQTARFGDRPGTKTEKQGLIDYIVFLDTQTGLEERNSFEWAVERAKTQHAYNRLTGLSDMNHETADPVFSLLSKAFQELDELPGDNRKLELTNSYLEAKQAYESANDVPEIYTANSF